MLCLFLFFLSLPPTTWFFGGFFQFFSGALWASYSLCGTRPGGKVRLNEGWEPVKKRPSFHALSGDACRSVAVNDTADWKPCCFFFFQMTWLVNFSDLHKHLPSGHAWSICIAWIWIQVECREHAERQEAANGNLDFWRCETLLRIMTGCFSIPQVSFLSHQYLWDKIKWCTQWRNFIVTLFGRVVSQTFVFRRFSWIYAIRTSINSMKQKTWL